MAKIGKLRAQVERHEIYGTPRKIYDIRGRRPAARGRPRDVARRFVRDIAAHLKIGVAPRDLRLDKVVESPLGTHVYFQQQHHGRPVSGAWLKVDLDHDKHVYHVVNSCVPAELLAASERSPRKTPITKRVAVEKALAALGVSQRRVRGEITVEHVMFPAGKRVRPAWKLIVPVSDPPHDWRLYLSAVDGSLLHKEDMLKMAPGIGLVFDPNPVVTLDDTTLRQSRPIPSAAYRRVELPGLQSTGFLDGPFVTTRRTKKRYRSRKRAFLLERTQLGFTEVMAYFHIDRMQRYIQSLGFDNVNRRPIAVNVAASHEDNSFYSPATKALSFGTGGVDDAEDAEIILHEYGHSIQDDQIPGFGSSAEAGAMGEGFGDYLAASFFADAKPARFRSCVGSWDATAYSPEDPPCLRRLDGTKRYPRDVVKEVHADGEIWSACLWRIREALGHHAADRLILSHHFLISRDASFRDGALGLLLADRQLHGGAHRKTIETIFTSRGILPSARTKRAGYDPFRRDNRPARPAARA